MQPTTMMDIKEMEKNAPEAKGATFVADTDPDSLDEVTTAPQEQLKKLDSDTPKQPVGNNNNN